MSESTYYQAVEEFFVEKRGDPLFLSNSDWLLVHKWRRQGIPLRVVLRGIADTFEGRALSWSRDRKVGSLGYCRKEVEAARDRWFLAVGGGPESPTPAGTKLGRLAEALQAPVKLGGETLRLADEIARELAGRAADVAGPAALERWLQSRERALVAALLELAGPEAVLAHRMAIEADLLPYRDRMPAKVLDEIRAESMARRLLETYGLPRLSLLEP